MLPLDDELPTVFIVDDDPSVRKSLARLLETVHLRSRGYDSPLDFLSEAPLDAPGCAIVDVRMPGASGLDLQKELTRRCIAIPLIFVTAHASVPVAVRAMKAGAVEVLTKPFDDQVLLDAVHEALERDRAHRKELSELRALSARFETLTPREREVMALVVRGLQNKEIAATLGTSEKTVKVHRGQAMHKMSAGSLADLVRMADRIERSTASN
jgi:FixJ family two-component response regulator